MRIVQYIVFLVSIIRTKAIVVDWNGDKDKQYKHHNSLEFSPINNSTRELQKALKCTDGQVGGYACNNVNLQARMPLYSLGAFGPEEKMEASDIWGWTDPVTGIEYAIIGLFQGTVFVDLSTPQIPKVIAKLPATV